MGIAQDGRVGDDIHGDRHLPKVVADFRDGGDFGHRLGPDPHLLMKRGQVVDLHFGQVDVRPDDVLEIFAVAENGFDDLLLARLQLAEIPAVERLGRRLDRGQGALQFMGTMARRSIIWASALFFRALIALRTTSFNLIGGERLGDIIESPVLERFPGGFHIGVAGEDDDDDLRPLPAEGFEDLHSADSRHLEVGHDHIVVPGPGHPQPLLPRDGRLDFDVLLGEDPATTPEDDVLVVDEKEFSRHDPVPLRPSNRGQLDRDFRPRTDLAADIDRAVVAAG